MVSSLLLILLSVFFTSAVVLFKNFSSSLGVSSIFTLFTHYLHVSFYMFVNFYKICSHCLRSLFINSSVGHFLTCFFWLDFFLVWEILFFMPSHLHWRTHIHIADCTFTGTSFGGVFQGVLGIVLVTFKEMKN